jgi:hypothetical protein
MTGYCYKLEENNFDLKKWLLNEVIRAFGVCCILRDEGNMSFDEIKKHIIDDFQKNMEGYKKEIKERKNEYNKYQKLSYTEKANKIKQDYKKSNVEDKSTSKKHNIKYKQYTELITKIDKVIAIAPKDIDNILKFAKSQLKDTRDFDYKIDKHIQLIPLTEDDIETTMQNNSNNILESIEYSKKQLKETKTRFQKAIKFLNYYEKFINKNF